MAKRPKTADVIEDVFAADFRERVSRPIWRSGLRRCVSLL